MTIAISSNYVIFDKENHLSGSSACATLCLKNWILSLFVTFPKSYNIKQAKKSGLSLCTSRFQTVGWLKITTWTVLLLNTTFLIDSVLWLLCLPEALRAMEKVASHINEMQKIYEDYGTVFDQLVAEQSSREKEVQYILCTTM